MKSDAILVYLIKTTPKKVKNEHALASLVNVKERDIAIFSFCVVSLPKERGEARIQCLKPLLSPLFSAADEKKFPMVEQIGRGGDGGRRKFLR